MTPGYHQLWRKWQLYRNLMVGFFILNVFCVVSGFVLSFNYWGFKQSLRDQHKNELQKLSASTDLEREIAELENQIYVSAKTSTDRVTVFREAAQWQKLEHYLKASGLAEKFKIDESVIAQPKSALVFLKNIKTNLAGERKETFENLSKMVDNYSNTTWELISIGGLTLLFGLIVPGFIMWMLTRLLKRTTEELRRSAREIANEWLNLNAKHGTEAFKNIEFWVELALLGTQITGRAASHPMAQMTGELALLIRQELEKSRHSQAA